MFKNEYDVVIVGAGPGGSATAKTCAERGLDVAVFEKRQEIGSPKRCAEGLSSDAVELLGLKIPSKCIAQKINGALIYAPNGKCIEIDYGRTAGYILERKVFDKWLAEEAVRAGAKVFSKTKVTNVVKKSGFVRGVKINFEGKKMSVKSKVTVAADGVESKISRLAGLNTTNKLVNIDSGYQWEMVGIDLEDPKKIVLYFGNSIAPRGYVWIFPKGKDKANVGIGVAMTKKPAKEYLERFVESRPELKKGSITEVNSGGIPVGGFLRNMVLNGFLVVGDAAHQVNPIHGGGMKEATIAGRIAGNVIADSVEKGDVSKKSLGKYNELWWKQRGVHLEKIEKLRQVFEKLSDEELNELVDYLKGEDLVEFSRGRKLTRLAKLLMKKPKLIKLAKHLL
ncbi:MAG: NAD(P)/FAD-dependent oxidoreductase [Candidatus Micrarchaeota archaeon]|nr:NAD(P)/FAD-dependent oxidoreductase [Candidatus Micrarchaeota archaeon]